MTTSSADTIDLTRFLQSGDTVVWGQACAEPRALTRALAEQAASIGALRCFVGIPAESMITRRAPKQIQVHSYCGSGTNSGLHDAGRLHIWPVRYSDLPEMLSSGALRADVVLVQVSPADVHGRHTLGLADDYFSAAIDTARVVIAEINEYVPRTPGARTLTAEQITAAVHSDEPPGEMPAPTYSAQTRAVASQVARLIPDGATLQFGIGALPEAVLDALRDHRDLGIHSGILNDTAMELIEAGVANGARKTHNRGTAIAGLLGGSRRLFAWADHNPAVELRPTSYTHDRSVLATSHQLAAVNAAIEVDLTGAVNAESVNGRYVGAVGGAADFLRGAYRSPGGLPIIAVPSTAHGRSRIVPVLSGPTSTPRYEPIIVVTEHGVADLRGLPLPARVEQMIAIAHPDHRAALDAAADHLLATV